MSFKNFLDLSKNLNPNIQFMIKYRDQLFPLSKIKALQDRFLAESEQQAMTKAQIDKIFSKINHQDLPFVISIDNREINIFGLQINNRLNQAIIM